MSTAAEHHGGTSARNPPALPVLSNARSQPVNPANGRDSTFDPRSAAGAVSPMSCQRGWNSYKESVGSGRSIASPIVVAQKTQLRAFIRHAQHWKPRWIGPVVVRIVAGRAFHSVTVEANPIGIGSAVAKVTCRRTALDRLVLPQKADGMVIRKVSGDQGIAHHRYRSARLAAKTVDSDCSVMA